MARGDSKSSRGSSGYRYKAGPTRRVNYDAERRQTSQYYLDRLSSMIDEQGCGVLKTIADEELVRMRQAMAWRHSRHDWSDRARDKVVKHCGADAWTMLQGRVESAQQAADAQRATEQEARELQWKVEADAQRAKRIRQLDEQTRQIRQDIELTAGSLRSDFASALHTVEAYGQRQGEWLDDCVAAYVTGDGFGEEVRRVGSIKLQVTVSLDLSSSMWNNKLTETAFTAFRTIYGMLLEMKKEHADNLFVAGFVFAMGKQGTEVLSAESYSTGSGVYRGNEDEEEYHLGVLEGFRHDRVPMNAGEDTKIEPLFTRIEKWEKSQSDPGAVRLDLVITDGVLETKADILRASAIQDRRDGNLQSIFLNFLPEEDWSGSSVPFRCVQYAADKDNIVGMLRSLIADFVQVYL